MRSDPQPNTTAAGELGVVLRDLDYSESAISELLDDDAYAGEAEDLPVYARRLPDTRLATVIRALFLGLPVPEREAVRALGRRGVNALEATGLAEVGSDVVPRARVLPVDELLVAADGSSRGADDPPDYVAAYSPASHVCASLTPRRRVERALDVGTGSGAQALLAASHAGHVVATDVNPRALAYTQLNAALNGLTNVECRLGSLFEPVAGERFELITCNAPYVISPERRWAYRDAGHQGDGVSELVVGEAASHLAEGGFATLLVSWLARDEDEPDERVLEWAERTGCDSWILVAWETDALGHAAGWNSHLADDPDAFGAALDEWLGYFDRLGVGWVSEGAVVLHRRPGGRQTARADSFDDELLEDAGEQIERAFEARARLSELRTSADLLEARLSVVAALRLEQDVEPEHGVTAARISLDEGTYSTVETTGPVLAIVSSLDGRPSLGAAVEAVAERLGLSETDASKLRREALRVSRELLELGALRFL
ncbi:MAG TPA: class I SAM-dependent methyltransferase [Gaiellaceae bacterium]|jgi:methylase of polypeptide subunit release factors|nr:class I SAM-dependent methyltransferase [Gaiellaceae bacterium]